MPKGTVLMRRPSTVWLSWAHSLAEGQQASPGKQRQLLLLLLLLLLLMAVAEAEAVRASTLVQRVGASMMAEWMAGSAGESVQSDRGWPVYMPRKLKLFSPNGVLSATMMELLASPVEWAWPCLLPVKT